MMSLEKHKIVLIGDAMVGKTSLLHSLTRGVFLSDYRSTVCTGFSSWRCDSEQISLQIWDTAGQERYRAVGGIFYQNAEAAIVVFDKSDRESLNGIKEWISHFQNVAGKEPLVIVVANKTDLAAQDSDDSRKIAEWATTNGFLYKETSAKTRNGVIELFQCVANCIQGRSSMIRAPTAVPVDAVRNLGGTVRSLSDCC
jgi:small GTP-binding protein